MQIRTHGSGAIYSQQLACLFDLRRETKHPEGIYVGMGITGKLHTESPLLNWESRGYSDDHFITPRPYIKWSYKCYKHIS